MCASEGRTLELSLLSQRQAHRQFHDGKRPAAGASPGGRRRSLTEPAMDLVEQAGVVLKLSLFAKATKRQ
jgi:hypothetical protein